MNKLINAILNIVLAHRYALELVEIELPETTAVFNHGDNLIIGFPPMSLEGHLAPLP